MPSDVKSDIEIAQQAQMHPIGTVAAGLGIPDEAIEPYGHFKGKVSLDYLDALPTNPDAKLVLVTAISPTPAGEGKTRVILPMLILHFANGRDLVRAKLCAECCVL